MSQSFQIIISIILFMNITCLFTNVKFIKSFEDSKQLYDLIKKTKKLSLVLIYSDGCPHCKNFEPHYIRLSEEYNSVVNFYLLPNKFNKKQFNIRGVPTVFFFNGRKFIEHTGLNNFDIISYILENDYLKKCKEVNYDFLFNPKNSSLLYNKKIEQNFVIGYFPNENTFYNEDENSNIKINKIIRKKTLESFIKKTQNIIGLLDNCYYIKDLNDDSSNNNILKEGTVIGFSKSKGINIFTGYQDIFLDNDEDDEKFYQERVKEVGKLYSIFLNDKIMDYYIDIIDSKMSSQLKAFVKRNVIFFVYKNEKEKLEYINQINSLVAMTKNDKYPLFDYVLFKYGCNVYKISYYLKSNGIYYADKNMNKISKKISLDIIIDMINTQNTYEYNEKNLKELMDNKENNTNNSDINNETNYEKSKDDIGEMKNKKSYINKEEQKRVELYYEKIKKQIIEHQLRTYLDNLPEETFFSFENFKTAIFFILCLIGYSFGFDYFYKKYNKGRSIFHVFDDFCDCLKLLFCEDDEEEFDIEQQQVKVKNKKIDDIDEVKPKMVKVQFK